MQYLLGLPKFTEKPVFVPELFVLVRKRLDHDFFNQLTLMLSGADGNHPKKTTSTRKAIYKKRFGMLPTEVQADKLYLGKANRKFYS